MLKKLYIFVPVAGIFISGAAYMEGYIGGLSNLVSVLFCSLLLLWLPLNNTKGEDLAAKQRYDELQRYRKLILSKKGKLEFLNLSIEIFENPVLSPFQKQHLMNLILIIYRSDIVQEVRRGE